MNAFNFYGIFAVCMTFAFAMGWLPWVGSKMAAAQKRAAETGALDAAGAEPMMPPNGPENQAEGYEPSLLDFFVPIGVLLGIGVLPTVLFDANWIDEAFVCCAQQTKASSIQLASKSTVGRTPIPSRTPMGTKKSSRLGS